MLPETRSVSVQQARTPTTRTYSGEAHRGKRSTWAYEQKGERVSDSVVLEGFRHVLPSP